MARYVHDCPACIFLGEYGKFDLYVHCEQPIKVIARRGDEGSDYVSGRPNLTGADELAEFYPELMEAKKRALDRGLIKHD